MKEKELSIPYTIEAVLEDTDIDKEPLYSYMMENIPECKLEVPLLREIADAMGVSFGYVVAGIMLLVNRHDPRVYFRCKVYHTCGYPISGEHANIIAAEEGNYGPDKTCPSCGKSLSTANELEGTMIIYWNPEQLEIPDDDLDELLKKSGQEANEVEFLTTYEIDPTDLLGVDLEILEELCYYDQPLIFTFKTSLHDLLLAYWIKEGHYWVVPPTPEKVTRLKANELSLRDILTKSVICWHVEMNETGFSKAWLVDVRRYNEYLDDGYLSDLFPPKGLMLNA